MSITNRKNNEYRRNLVPTHRSVLFPAVFQTLLAVLTAALTFFSALSTAHAQEMVSHRLVSAPTAGTLSSGSYLLETHLFDGGGVTERIVIGITDYVFAGISYSGSNIIGSKRVTWQPHAGAQLQIRIIEESMRSPAFSIGFDSQGSGSFIPGNKLNRFRAKSKGAYIVISRNYRMLGDLGMHAGANYSFETDDGDKDSSFWVGINKSITNRVELCCEYDFATNDNDNDSITSGAGYFNSAVKLNLSGAFTLEFDIQNILRNTKTDLTGQSAERPEPSREIRIMYHAGF